MANYWAITIGINQYRHLQPLMHAQDDARFTHRFFTKEAGISADNCVLLSDLATSVGQQVVYPDKAAIAQWIQTITQQIEADDVLWFFFSGYGAQSKSTEGELVDYLMPIDGDPGQIETTGIALADLINTLADVPTDKALLVLDINRPQGALSGQTIGTQVIDLAQKRQLATLLSCQPEQYSHETLGVRHGLFTAALLEALHQNCKTIGQVSDYVTQRLPELCEHHWRPIQNPVSLIPERQMLAEVVPDVQEAAVLTTATASTDTEGVESKGVKTEDAGMAGIAIAPPLDSNAADDIATPMPALEPPVITPPYTEENTSTGTYREAASADDDGISGAKLRNLGLIALGVLMVGVLLKQPFTRTAWSQLTNRTETVVATDDADENAAEPVEASGAIAGEATAESETAVVEDAAEANAAENAATAEEAAAGEAAAGEATAGEDSVVAAEQAPASEEEQAAAKKLISEANSAVGKRQYSEALIALQQVPRSQRDETFSTVLTKARAGAAEATQANATVLTEARTSIQPTQASQFTEAIAKARLIQPGEPYYDTAQKDIRGWSQIILDIAEGRATSGNLNGAIAAAKVMPNDNTEFHQKAQDRVAFWQQRQQSRDTIQAAQTIPKLGEASTYQQGIVKLREVPIEHPEYEAAQRLADQWSQSIFSIAQARAAQGRQSAAIQAAVLVPAGTTAYEPTQKAIQRWRAEETEATP